MVVNFQNSANPFEYDPATSFTAEQIINYYIEDFNYSRFIDSTMNLFLLGERGSGKTMALRYHSYEVQKKRQSRNPDLQTLNRIGIYVSCKSHLFQKKEADLIPNSHYKVASIYEIFLVATISHALVSVLEGIEETFESCVHEELIQDFEYLVGDTLYKKANFFETVRLYIERVIRELQDLLNNPETAPPVLKALNFYTFIEPLLNLTKKFPVLRESHILFLIDDIQDLNETQIKLLNSWHSSDIQ